MTMRFRIASIFIAAALILSCGVLAAGHLTLSAQREAVSLEETTLLGDVAAAEDVQVDIHTQLAARLFWDTRYTAGTSPSIHTDYTHYWTEQSSVRDWQSDVLWADFMGSAGVTSWEWEEEDESGMEKPYNDVASRCPAGQDEYTERVYLRDYYEYFPIYVHGVDILPEDVTSIYLAGGESLEMMMQDFLRSQFRFPVPEDLWVEITIGKSADGSISLMGTGAYSDDYWMNPIVAAVRTEKGIYFTFSPGIMADGRGPDFSHCTVERGLYFLPVNLTPYEREDFAGVQEMTAVSLDTEHFRTVCPIAEDADEVSLYQSSDGQWIYLVSQQPASCTLTVLRADTGAVTSQVTLFPREDPEMQYLWQVYCQEGYLIATRSDGAFALVTVDDAGQAEMGLTGDFAPVQAKECYLRDPVFDYDGQRLAFADFATGYGTCSFFLGVMGPDGPEYLGKYYHNQEPEFCSPRDAAPLSVHLPDNT